LAKIAENSEHKIDPLIYRWYLFFNRQSKEFVFLFIFPKYSQKQGIFSHKQQYCNA
jgi:hypothetical protein